MSYYELPTRKRIYWISIPTVIIYVVLVFIADTFFPEIDSYWKKKFSQAGLTIIFSSGLFAGLGFIWSAKARHNLDLANLEKDQSRTKIEMLERIRDKLGQNIASEIEKESIIIEKANREIAAVNRFPKFINHAGFVSLLLLGVGTLFCIIGEG